MHDNGCCIVSLRRHFGTMKITEMEFFTIGNDVSHVLLVALVEVDAFESRATTPAQFLILHILAMRADANIDAAVVDSVVIYVIYFGQFTWLENKPMHIQSCFSVNFSDCISVHKQPTEPLYTRQIRMVHDGLHTVVERNECHSTSIKYPEMNRISGFCSLMTNYPSARFPLLYAKQGTAHFSDGGLLTASAVAISVGYDWI